MYNPFHEKGRREFRMSEDVSLVYAPGVGEGKTACMDKGLFLRFRGRLCSGGAAGFGLPVFRTGLQTFFPTLTSLVRTGDRAGELAFSMDRALFWYIAGKKAPSVLTRASEWLVEVYMRYAAHQHRMLKIHDRILSLCAAQGRMLPVQGIGHCRVCFEISGRDLHFQVHGSSLKRQGRLVVLNEVDGQSFDLLRSGGALRQGRDIPAWEEAGFDAELGSSRLGIGISLCPEVRDDSPYRLFCGREVGRGLNWAGLALMGRHPVAAYRLRIHERISL
jgi:hypothetical protein